MKIYEKIRSALAPLGIPVQPYTYTGTEPVYIVMHSYLDTPELIADDTESVRGRYAQVDLIGKGNLSSLVDQMEGLLIQAGFIRRGGNDGYDEDTGLCRYTIRIADFEEDI